MKNFKSLFTALLLLLCTMDAGAHNFEVGGIYYNLLSGGNVEVTFRGRSSEEFENEYTGVITIPETVEYYGITYNVISVGNSAFENCYGLKGVVIPNSVTGIGEYAFSSCYHLTEVAIGSNVASIGEYAFANCSDLTGIELPSNLSTIEYNAFDGCKSITSIVIPKSVTKIFGVYGVLGGCENLASITVDPENTYYDSRQNCNAIIETATNTLIAGCMNSVIPNSVTSIEYGAFEGCVGLTSITIPNSVTRIGVSAFSGCSGLISIILPDGISHIDAYMLMDCSSLTNIEIPNGITAIYERAFEGCTALESIVIPGSVTHISEGAFALCSALASIVVDSKNIAYDTRENCNALIETSTNTLIRGCENSVIPNGVKRIAKGAFSLLPITSIKIPNGVTSIGSNAFQYCYELADITIPNSITSIEDNAFDNCRNLKTVVNLSDLNIVPGSEDNGGVAIYADEVFDSYLIYDTKGIDYNEVKNFDKLYYKRTFANTGWQPWYMPFDVELSDVENELEVACLNNVHQYDDNKDGEIDRTELEAISLVDGVLTANYPYIVRAKSTGTKNFVFDNVTIEPFENNSYDCSSLSTKFIFTGYNNAIDYNSSYYELENDCLALVTNTVTKLTQLNNDKVYTLRSARAFLLYSSNVPDEICSSNGWSVGDVSRDINDVNQHFKIKSINGKYYLYSVAAGKYVNGDGKFVANATDALVFENAGGEYQWKLGVGNHVLNSQEWHRAASGMRVDDWATTDEGNCYIIEEARTTLAPNRWYLSVEARSSMHKAPAQIRLFVRDGAATAIEEVEEPCNGQDSLPVIYDLSGRRVENPTKGIYIVNGEKVVIK